MRTARDRALPGPAGNARLRLLARRHVAAKHDLIRMRWLITSAPEPQQERTAAMPEPQFVRAHDVPARLLTGVQHEVDGRARTAQSWIAGRLERRR